ncbi:MAG: T9SS type A sorting domain-containing protein [Bacteroidota bacterium]|nr:T9SS type A sorting domain-containing protein [Bacteroidota bacterium]MDP3145262.1 T9SS type A sorting domain-containing protein [Bacteroidota bacterium]
MNLVPNPSFENVAQCPFSFGLEAYTTDWKSARATPDYFNSCSSWSGASTPTNGYGYQLANSGNSYIGMLTYRSDSSIYSEAASVQLTNPLILGQTYYVSFRLSLTLDDFTESNTANNKIGVQFSTVDYLPSNPLPINNFAHVWSDSIITDTLNWSIIKGSFVADSNYTHLSLGNFFDKPYVDTIIYGTNFGGYYFFDDVCVSTDSVLCYSSVGINEYNNKDLNITVYPSPVINYVTIKNNKATTPYDVTVINSLGQIIYKEQKLYGIGTINAEQFDNGVLTIEIKFENKKSYYKLIKQ